MTEEGKKYLSDIKMAIKHLEDFTHDTKNFNNYAIDFKTQSATERHLANLN